MKLKRISLIFFLAFLLFTVSVSASEPEGYIVSLKENTAMNISASYFGEASLFSDMSDEEAANAIIEEIENVDEISAENRVVIAKDKDALDELIEMGVVEYYEKDFYAELFGYDLAKNPSYTSQKWVYDAVNADFINTAGLFGNDVRVGVIDTGVYPNNDIVDNLVEGRNFDDNMTNFDASDTTDNYFHGTAAAGIIAASCNDKSIVGVAHKASIVPLKVANDSTVYVSKIVNALYASVDDFDCDVVNLSLGTTTNSTTLKAAIDHVISKGAIVVAAAGNNGQTGYQYPASYDEVISVANVTKSGNSYAIYSSSQVNDKVDVACPGTSVVTLANTKSGTTTRTGTSFSAPFVAGIAALAKMINPDLTQAQFGEYIAKTSNSSYISESQGSNYWGNGMLDVGKLLKAVLADSVKDKFYTTPIDVNGSNESFYITNASGNTVSDFSVVLEEYSSSSLVGFKVITDTLSPFESVEISLTDNGFTNGARVKYVTSHVPGDINDDKAVNIKDVTRLMQIIAGWSFEALPEALDVNGDNTIDLKDVTRLLQYIAGWTVTVE